jgi:hypothetical protein
VRKITQEEIDRVTDPSLKTWMRHSMLNGIEIPESEEERIRIAQQESDMELFRIIENIIKVQSAT